jgi:hypothetical protein
MSSATFSVPPRDTILSLELSWMGGGSLRGRFAATVGVEMQTKQSNDLCCDQGAASDQADIAQEYQELVAVPEIDIEPEVCAAPSAVETEASVALRKKVPAARLLRQATPRFWLTPQRLAGA